MTVTLLPEATVLAPPTIESTDVAVDIAPGLTVIAVVEVTLVAPICAPKVVDVPEVSPVRTAE